MIQLVSSAEKHVKSVCNESMSSNESESHNLRGTEANPGPIRFHSSVEDLIYLSEQRN